MDNDDKPIGRILSRREVLMLFGVTGAAALAACTPGADATPTATANAEAATVEAIAADPTAVEATQAEVATLAATQAELATAAATNAALPACVVRLESTEGPFFVDTQLERSDIRLEPSTGEPVPGMPLALAFNVGQVSGGACAALAGALVDVWHCDAAGVYSGVAGSGQTKFLRGFQTTDASGLARFTSIFPGWYPGRAVHIHYKIRVMDAAGGAYDFTSQLYFDEAVTAEVFAREPYAARGQAETSNAMDGIYQPEGLLTLTPDGDGYAAHFDIALDLA